MTLSVRAFAVFVLALAVPLTGHADTFQVGAGGRIDGHDMNPGLLTADAGNSIPHCHCDTGLAPDSGPSCTLRAAIEESNACPGGPHTIIVPGGSPFFLQLGSLAITASVIIRGSDRQNRTIIDAGRRSGVLSISNPGTNAKISNVTIRNGRAHSVAGVGIEISKEAQLVLENSIVSNNIGNILAPGIFNSGVLTLLRSTVRNNQICDIIKTDENGNFQIDGNGNLVCLEIGGGGLTSLGGGIRNEPTGTLNVKLSTISKNVAVRGGGIYNAGGIVNIHNSTISGNQASRGAGIVNDNGIMDISFSTITANETIMTGDPLTLGGGIVIVGGGAVNIGNTILAANADKPLTPPGDPFSPECHGTFKSLGGNIVGLTNRFCLGFVMPCDQFGEPRSTCDRFHVPTSNDNIGTPADSLDPLLKPLTINNPLAFNSGLTETHALKEFSPARDHGTGAIPPPRRTPFVGFFDCPAFDQNRIPRPQSPAGIVACDVGAFEAIYLD